MKRFLLAVFLFGLITIFTFSVFRLNEKTKFNQLNSTNETKSALENYGKMPLSFEENRGQTDERVKFLSRGAGYNLFLTESEMVLALHKTAKDEKAESVVLRMSAVGGKSPSKIEGEDEQNGKSNYFIDADASKWLRDVPNYSKVRYAGIYDGVDLIYYGKGQQLEFDFVVEPNADFRQIALKFEGARKIELSADGDLLLELDGGLIKQHKPSIYQETNGERKEIAGNYVLKNETEVGFAIEAYDASKPLVIDPVLVYATYLGSEEYEVSSEIAVDAAGNAYITGYAVPPAFPTTPGSVRPTVSNPQNSLFPFVSKISANGSTLLYSTYLGGAGISIAVDAAGNAYTLGTPGSGIFATTPGALDMGRGSVAVTKLNPQGNQIIYAARFGSSGTDTPRAIAIDLAGNAYVTGTTNCGFTTSQCDFPILNAPQPNYITADSFISELNSSGTALIYSTYLGGSALDRTYAIDVDSSGSAYVTGETTSSNFPTTAGAFDRTYNCNPQFICRSDVFVTKIAPNGGTFVYSTYIGGLGQDEGQGIAVDNSGNAYIGGPTQGRFSGAPEDGYPTTPGAFKMFGSIEGFVTKLNPTGSTLVYSSLLGGIDSDCFEERINDIDIDRLGNAYVVGMTSCGSFPTANALQPAPSSFREEAFLTKFNPQGSTLVYSTFLGGPRYDEAYAVAVDAAGSAYVTGTTSGDFQLITPGAYDTTWNGADAEHPDDIFVMKVSERLRSSQFDFDGDGRADIAAFRPSNSNWYIANSSNNSNSERQFGVNGDLIAPADFDGDGKSDIAVFRPSTGTWYWLNSTTNAATVFGFGANGDLPAPADFDGDGKADVAVFRPSTGTWWIFRSANNSVFAQNFGIAEDKPTLGDFDGDGKADLAVFRPSSGVWYHLRSSNNQFVAQQFGLGSDVPTPADFDGDGKTDISVFRPSNGVWYRVNSLNNSVTIFQFGLADDKPVAADYDGDGRADIAVFRPGESVWYLQRSSQGFTSKLFGASEDLPVPNAFVR
jgi:FG-GAP-like repeat/Beta-propeller repeat/FG-GAP repeat